MNKKAELLAAAFSYNLNINDQRRKSAKSPMTKLHIATDHTNSTPDIDKASDLVKIKNGLFSHKRMKSSYVSN
jgi:hypothetical protein